MRPDELCGFWTEAEIVVPRFGSFGQRRSTSMILDICKHYIPARTIIILIFNEKNLINLQAHLKFVLTVRVNRKLVTFGTCYPSSSYRPAAKLWSPSLSLRGRQEKRFLLIWCDAISLSCAFAMHYFGNIFIMSRSRCRFIVFVIVCNFRLNLIIWLTIWHAFLRLFRLW